MLWFQKENIMNKSTLIILLFGFLSPQFSNAQGWEKTYDGGVDEIVSAADRTLDGGVIMAGIQVNDTSSIETPFMYKTDEDGNLQWQFYKTDAANDFVQVYDVEALSDGNFLLTFVSSPVTPTGVGATIQKLDSNGNIIWSVVPGVGILDWARDAKETPSGDIMVVGGYLNTSNTVQSTGTIRLDADGNFLWSQGIESDSILPYWSGGLAICADGGVVTVGYYGFFNGDQSAFATKYDSTGNIVWENEYFKQYAQFAIDAIEMPTGEILMGGMSATDFNEYDAALYKLDADGNETMFQSYPLTGSENMFNIRLTPDGNIAMAGNVNGIGAGDDDFYLMKLDTAGTVLWTNTFGRSNSDILSDVMVTDDNKFYLAGYTEKSDNSIDAFLIKTDSLGNSITNELNGKLYFDENLDCVLDGNENGFAQWLIEAKKGDLSYLALTDTLGDYSITLDTGTYEILVFPVSPYWEVCDSSFTVNFTNFFETQTEDIAAQAIVDCPLLDISIGTTFLRRCFESTYFVQYCNYGTTTAEDANIEIILDPFMEFLSSSITLDAQIGDTLYFNVGDVNIGECGDFNFDILLEEPGLPCDSIPLGQTHCVEAYIFPDSLCLPIEDWSGASVEVDASCDGDSISFYIQNVGTAPTTSNLQYFVIEDDVILYQENFSLEPSENEVISIETNGSTFRLEAEQEPNHPGMSMPSVSVEGCGDENLIFTFGFVNIFAQDDGDPFVDIDCRQNTGAFDPNDKMGFPSGFGAENYIYRGQDIEYLVRFQNTGTDTAFNVVIRDKLSEFLDITSVRPGASSHPYDFGISAEGELIFTFENIMLPDSNINEAASHGFVKFKISQNLTLPLETKIYNSAAIYFDFNAPVITNETLHTIGESIFTVSIDPVLTSENQVTVYPNPFSNFAKFEIEGKDIQNGVFKLYDVTGRLIRREHFSSNNFILHKKELPTGMYFFTIENAGQLIASGKIVAQ